MNPLLWFALGAVVGAAAAVPVILQSRKSMREAQAALDKAGRALAEWQQVFWKTSRLNQQLLDQNRALVYAHEHDGPSRQWLN